ncbi:MAG: hypothetical protein NTZ51_11435 [Proteobacteria bacterium]|nr:hypothetical protein [Pseudomonadota bacterium]
MCENVVEGIDRGDVIAAIEVASDCIGSREMTTASSAEKNY